MDKLLDDLNKFKATVDRMIYEKHINKVLLFYKELQTIKGLREWGTLSGEECSECIQKKKMLLKTLIGEMKQINDDLFESIDTLHQSSKNYKEDLEWILEYE